MVRLKNPLFSFDAHGTIGDSVTFQSNTKRKFARQKPSLPYSMTLPQQYQRWLYEDYAYRWTQESQATRQEYREGGSRFHLTGYQYYMKYMLSNLPDIEALWHFDSISGGLTPDFSRHSRAITVFGASSAPGVISQALLFDGLNDQLSLPNAQTPDFSTVLSLGSFVKLNVLKNHNYLITKWLPSPVRSYMVRFLIDGRIQFAIYQQNNVYINVVSVLSLSLSTWHSVYAIADGSFLRIYLDGQEDINTIAYNGTINTSNTDPIDIGEDAGVFADFDLDHFIMYNRALDPTEILRHSKRRFPP